MNISLSRGDKLSAIIVTLLLLTLNEVMGILTPFETLIAVPLVVILCIIIFGEFEVK